MFAKDNKSELFTPGFICVLHTFGRDLKWNPHIHCLISEGGIGNSGLWRAKTHFNYTYLRNAFRTALHVAGKADKAIRDKGIIMIMDMVRHPAHVDQWKWKIQHPFQAAQIVNSRLFHLLAEFCIFLAEKRIDFSSLSDNIYIIFRFFKRITE